MLKNFADDFVLFLIHKKIIQGEQRELYAYGTEVILLNLFNVIIALSIALISKTWIHFFVFLLCFVPLRITCGGYHAKTSEVCLIISTIIYIITTIFYMMIDKVHIWSFIILIICVLMIIVFSPVENENNELSPKSRKKNKSISIILISLDSIIFTIFELNHSRVALSILIFIVLECVFMLIEIIRKIGGKF